MSMQYYSAIKRNEIGSFVVTWMDIDTILQSELSQKEKDMWRLKNQYRWSYLESRNRDIDIENKHMDIREG